MLSKSGKVSVKLNEEETKIVDFLIEKGIYKSRLNFADAAVKAQIKIHAGDLAELYERLSMPPMPPMRGRMM